jgi:CIC family chloride channel protein
VTPGESRPPAWATALQDWRARLQRSTDAERLRQHEDKVLLVLTLVIGAVVSLVIVAFILVTENLGARLYPAGGAWWRRAVVPTVGALVSGILLFRYFRDARGSGIPQTKAALFLRDGFIPFRTVVGKFTCASLSLASGIALGREGPAVQVGAGIASSLGRRLGLGPTRVRTLVPVGASAALAAAFNTPIAAVLFSLEEVVGDLHAPVLGSIVLSSATSWMVLHLLLGDEPLFHVPAYQLVHPLEFLVYSVLGLIGGLVSVAFVKLLLGIRRRFLAMPARTVWFQPAAGGAFVGVMGVFVPAVLGVGYSHVGEALNGTLAIGTMAVLLGLKLVATAACYGSGNAGGIFGPSLFLGAMMGGAVGGTAHWLLPDYTGGIGAYALVGMGAAFAGIIRVPMTSVIMIFEITRDYTIIVPLMIANLVSYFVSSRLQPVPIYEALQLQEGIRLPPPREDRDGLLRVAQAMRSSADLLPANGTVRDGIARISASGREADVWLVMDGNLPVGSVTLADLERADAHGRASARLADVVTESDAGRTGPEHVHPDQPADSALRRLGGAGNRALPVIAREDTSVVGSVSVPGIMAAYARTGTKAETPGPPSDTTSPRLLLAGVASTVALLLLFSGGLAYRSRESRLDRGRRALATGHTLMQQQRTQDAVQHFRQAVSQLRSTDARRALGLALLQAGALDEAQIYLQAVVEADAADGPANLGLARIAVARGSFEPAATYYERAMAGHWPERPDQRRLDVGFEFVDVLSRAGEKTRAVAELLR